MFLIFKADVELWRLIFHKMIDSYADKTHLITVLNTRNGNTETVLHILSKRDTMLDLVEYLLCLGVDISVCNASGETPIEVAWRFSMTIYNFYLLTTNGTTSTTPSITAIENNQQQQQRRKPKNSFSGLSTSTTLRQTSINTSKNQQQQQRANFSSNNDATTAASIRQTRASLGLSQTIDYTGFFKDGSSSSDSGGSSESDDNDECSLERKVTSMNRSMFRRLDEISSPPSTSQPSTNKNNKPQQKLDKTTKKRKRNIEKMKKQYNKQTLINAHLFKQHDQQRRRRKRLKMMDVTTSSSDEDSTKTSKNSSNGGTSSSGDSHEGDTSGTDNNSCSGSRSSSSSSSGEELDDIVKSLKQRNHNTERHQMTIEGDGETNHVKTLREQNWTAITIKDDEDEHGGSNEMSTNDREEFDHADKTNYDDANDAVSDKGIEIQSGYHGNEMFEETKNESSEDSERYIFSDDNHDDDDDDDDDDGDGDIEGEKQQEKDKMAKEEILRKICRSIQRMYTLYEMEPSLSQKGINRILYFLVLRQFCKDHLLASIPKMLYLLL